MSQSVVFATPTMPSFHGNGLAMRAAATLHLLSAWGAQVHLLVIPIFNSSATEPEPEVAQMCRSWQVVSNPYPDAQEFPEWLGAQSGLNIPAEWINCNSCWQDAITTAIGKSHPDLIFVFRFYLAPLIIESAGSTIPLWLDIDEVESISRSRLARLYTLIGRQKDALALRLEALAYEKFETEYLSHCERIFACSKIETAGVITRCPQAKTQLLPNIYPSIRPQKRRQADGKARFLYVGTLGYFPNVDAIVYFCREVLPRLRARAAMPVELDVIGTGLSNIDELLSIQGVNLIGQVPETTPYYANCDAAVVPLRAAGGTRIKILEAFSHQRAVVSTSIGAEGLDVTDGIHLRLAESVEDFSDQCLRLINNVDERDALAERGHKFFKERHTLQMLEETLPQIFGNWSV